MYYKFNLKYNDFTWIGSRACKKKNLISPQWLRNIKERNYPWWRLDAYFSQLKYLNIEFVENGGWHFSYIKSAESIEKKLRSYLHHREYDLNPLGIDKINEMIKNCKSGPLLAEVENVVINSVDQLTQVNKNIKGIKILETI